MNRREVVQGIAVVVLSAIASYQSWQIIKKQRYLNKTRRQYKQWRDAVEKKKDIIGHKGDAINIVDYVVLD